jgi:phenylpropionate dioxygenase-like ring-hydroxylating dioxygenase large terminal subunit
MSTANHFLKNTWYVAAWSHEISEDGMLARTIIRMRLLFWRDATGR